MSGHGSHSMGALRVVQCALVAKTRASSSLTPQLPAPHGPRDAGRVRHCMPAWVWCVLEGVGEGRLLRPAQQQ